MPLSPHANSKTMSLSGKRNVKNTKLQKKNGIKSSTPLRPSMPKAKAKSFHELKLIAENELNKAPPLPDRFVGDKSLSGVTIDNVAMKFFPADTPQ